MGATYHINLDETWSNGVWPGLILVSKSFNNEPSKQYFEGKIAYAQISLSNDGATGTCKCSNCHRTIDQYFNYCCYCGAKIIGKQLVDE